MFRTFFLVLLVLSATTLNAETILKFDLGSAGVDFQLTGSTLSTISDGVVGTLGDQNTNVNFTGFLAGMTDITADIASFSLEDVSLDGMATLVGSSVVVQPTTGGEFFLWDDLNQLLLSGTLTDGSISGAIGPVSTGSFFNLNLDDFTGGSLMPLLDPNSLSMAISFTDVNNGLGFTVANDVLQPFTAAGTANIAASVPEPSSIAIALFGLVGLMGFRRRN